MKPIYVLLGLLCAASAQAGEDKPREFDWGFVASRQVMADGRTRFRALGPFYERTEWPAGQRLFATRPFYSSAVDPEADGKFRDILWPLGSSKRMHDQARWRFILMYRWNYDIHDPVSKRRFWIFPFYYQGRSGTGERYWALWPLGGRIHDFIMLDKTEFVLWPLYVRSERASLVSHTYLWPFISRTRGGGIEKFRVFPVYGSSRFEDRFRKKFIMWPFWTSARVNYPRSTGRAFILWPLVGRMRSPNQNTWMFLPPLIRVTRGERQDLTHGPWPFIQHGEGEFTKKYFWPIWGTKRGPSTKDTFFLWPFGRIQETDRATTKVYKRQVAPLAWWDKEEVTVPGNAEAEERAGYYRKFWPFFSVSRRGDHWGYRTLELWPFKKNPRPMDRSWAPLWTLWSKSGVGDDADTEFLWGLYRSHRRGPNRRSYKVFPLAAWESSGEEGGSKEWSLLEGLIGYEREGTQKSLRLLYFLRFGKRSEASS